MTDSEMMELDESDSSSGTDSDSEYEEPTAKRHRPVDYDESPARKKSKRARRQPLQQKKSHVLKSMARKILTKSSRKDSKEDEAEDTEAAGDTAMDTPSGKTGDKRNCQLCGAKPSDPSQHIACFHLKKHLFTCPECDGYGSGRRRDVLRHMKQHTSDVGKLPISHVAAYTAEMQQLQAICFPTKQLRASRPPKDTYRRVNCMLCNDKVISAHREHHVYGKHFKKEGLFECPCCATSRQTFDAVTHHIKAYHKKEYGKVQPISHERKYEKEISALNEKCFPGWQKKSSNGKKKRPVQKENSEAEGEEMSSESEWGFEKESKGKRAPKKSAEEEDEEEMEEGKGGRKGRA